MDFLIATHNMKKRDELQRILSPLGVHVLTADEAGVDLTDVEETGTTFEENALLKARSGCKEGKMPCIADDSGLCVDALDGAPGVYSARFAGEHGNDKANNKKLLELTQGVDERGCGFASAVALCRPGRDDIVVRGVCRGQLLHEERGTGGFGYDPLFLSDELGKTFAEANAQEKNAVSHRARAIAALRAVLDEE